MVTTESPSVVLQRCLADLEERIDLDVEAGQLAAWKQFLQGEWPEPLFIAPPRPAAPARVDWPAVHINDAQGDMDLMILKELSGVSGALHHGGSHMLLNVRCNYGTGILPTLFACELYMMPPETHTLPTAIPLHSADAVRRLVDRGVPDVRSALGAKVFDTAEHYLSLVQRYPKLAQAVTLYHPDTQGPIDVAEVVWGSEIFYALYDEPELVEAFLDLVTDSYAAFMREWFALVPDRHSPYSVHWGQLMTGRLMLRNDSLMNLSPQTYVELIRPRDQRLFDEFGGGAVHFCGRGDHYIAAMSEMAGLSAINFSQPECNDMETLFRHTVDKGLVLLNLRKPAAEAALAAGRDLHHRAHCWPWG